MQSLGNQLTRSSLPSPSKADLDELAAEFAAHIPDDTYTPAEIQNHLMRFKKEPEAAVDKVDDWTEEMTAEKDKQNEADNENDDPADGDHDGG